MQHLQNSNVVLCTPHVTSFTFVSLETATTNQFIDGEMELQNAEEVAAHRAGTGDPGCEFTQLGSGAAL